MTQLALDNDTEVARFKTEHRLLVDGLADALRICGLSWLEPEHKERLRELADFVRKLKPTPPPQRHKIELFGNIRPAACEGCIRDNTTDQNRNMVRVTTPKSQTVWCEQHLADLVAGVYQR